MFIADKIAAIRADHSCVNNQFLIVTYSAIENIKFIEITVTWMFSHVLYGVIKVELEKQNKQGFYTVVQEKK